MHTCLGCSLHTWSHTAAYGNAPPDRSFLGRLHYRMKFVVHSSAHRLDPGFLKLYPAFIPHMPCVSFLAETNSVTLLMAGAVA